MVVDPEKIYLEWAILECGRGVDNNFQRADAFDGIGSRRCVSALRTLPREQLSMLAHLLPRRMGSEDPKVAAVKFNLSEVEQRALQCFMEARGRLQREMWSEFSLRIGRTSKREFQLQFRTARKECDRLIQNIAEAWNCKILPAGAGEWCLVGKRDWGEIKIPWKLQRDLELTYAIILDSPDVGGVRASHYLGALGVGPSLWVMEDSSKCKEVVAKAQEFIAWHVEECDKVMASCLALSKQARLAASTPP